MTPGRYQLPLRRRCEIAADSKLLNIHIARDLSGIERAVEFHREGSAVVFGVIGPGHSLAVDLSFYLHCALFGSAGSSQVTHRLCEGAGCVVLVAGNSAMHLPFARERGIGGSGRSGGGWGCGCGRYGGGLRGPGMLPPSIARASAPLPEVDEGDSRRPGLQRADSRRRAIRPHRAGGWGSKGTCGCATRWNRPPIRSHGSTRSRRPGSLCRPIRATR